MHRLILIIEQRRGGLGADVISFRPLGVASGGGGAVRGLGDHGGRVHVGPLVVVKLVLIRLGGGGGEAAPVQGGVARVHREAREVGRRGPGAAALLDGRRRAQDAGRAASAQLLQDRGRA